MGKKEDYGIYNGFDLKYETRLVAFLDILGFSKLIHDRRDDDVDFVVNLIPDMLKTHVGQSARSDLEVTNISDSIIVSLKTSPDDKELKDLFHISVIIGRLQHEMALSGFYLRGAITVGEIFHDSKRNIIVGPAFIRAYDLEVNSALMPRVICDNRILDFYQLNHSEFQKALNTDFCEYFYQGKISKKCDRTNGLKVNDYDLFVDYVSSIFGRAKHGFKKTPLKFLRQLLLALRSGVAYDKYLWLALYTVDVVKNEDIVLDSNCEDIMREIMTLIKKPSCMDRVLRFFRF